MMGERTTLKGLIRTAAGACAAILLLAGAARSAQPAAASLSSATTRPAQKYQPVTEEEAKTARDKAEKIAAKTREAVTPNLHLVETAHYWIYSAWDKSNDAALKDICEGLYKALCTQFDIPSTENIWAGKCALYIFWEKGHFLKFAKDVDGSETDMSKAAGYQSGRGGGFRYIVLGPARTKSWFFEVLTHEGTHAFISRYLNNRLIPEWANEGLAEYMSSVLVPNSNALYKMKSAMKEARGGRDVSHVFKEVRLESYDYGIAQSFVQFLIAKNKKGFVNFITDIKMGKSEEEALKDNFGWTQQDLVKNWRAAIR